MLWAVSTWESLGGPHAYQWCQKATVINDAKSFRSFIARRDKVTLTCAAIDLRVVSLTIISEHTLQLLLALPSIIIRTCGTRLLLVMGGTKIRLLARAKTACRYFMMSFWGEKSFLTMDVWLCQLYRSAPHYEPSSLHCLVRLERGSFSISFTW